jgi:hypothetical protein
LAGAAEVAAASQQDVDCLTGSHLRVGAAMLDSINGSRCFVSSCSSAQLVQNYSTGPCNVCVG